MILPGYLADILGSFAYHLPQLVIAVVIILAGVYILTRKKDSLNDRQSDIDNEEHYWTPYQQNMNNIPDMDIKSKTPTTQQPKKTQNITPVADTSYSEVTSDDSEIKSSDTAENESDSFSSSDSSSDSQTTL